MHENDDVIIYIKQQAQYVAYNIDVSFSFSTFCILYKYQGGISILLCFKIQ